MIKANVDYKDGNGDVASKIATYGVGGLRPFIGKDGKAYMTVYNGGDPKKASSYKTIQTNKGTLRDDEWKQLDNAVLETAKSNLNGFQDILNRGLSVSLGDAMGTTIFQTSKRNGDMTADVTMNGRTKANNDRPTYEPEFLPIPIIHADYEIGTRALRASRKGNTPLDTVNAEDAARAVMEVRENMLFTATEFSFGGGTIYSFLNEPNRNTDTGLNDWTDTANVTGKDIVNDVNNVMKAGLLADHYGGPYVLYVNSAVETRLDDDYSDTKGSNTIRDRILAINNIQDVVTVDALPSNTVLLVQVTSNVVRIVNGMGLSNIQWQTGDGFVNYYKAMAIQVPQVRSDGSGQSGVFHGSW